MLVDKKIAIMGAGLSGLSCAFELKKHDIMPDIYESRSEVEDRFVNMEAMLDILNKPIEDSFAYLADKFDLYLTPHSPIKRMEMFSEKSHASIKGALGFLTARGRHPLALGKQLAQKVKSPIYYNSKETYHSLKNKYDIIIMATGDGAYTRTLQRYSNDVSVKLWGATIQGEFDPTCVKMFLNNNFAPKGYAYLLPYNENEANLAIGTSVNDADMNVLKGNLLKHLNYTGEIKDEFQVRDYMIGHPERLRQDNTYFIGNCGGYVMPFLGFGQFGAMLSGLYAAKAIVYNQDFDKEMNFLKKSYNNSVILRRVMENLDNKDTDRLVATISGPLGNKLMNLKRFNLLKVAARIATPYYLAKKMSK